MSQSILDKNDLDQNDAKMQGKCGIMFCMVDVLYRLVTISFVWKHLAGQKEGILDSCP